MTLSQLEHFPGFLAALFGFFREYGIASSLDPLEDYDLLRDRLLGAELRSFTYLSNINKYSIEIAFDTPPEQDEVYSYLWGKSGGKHCSEFLVDIGANFSFLHVEIDSEKHPPLVRDFLNARGELRASCFGEEDRMILLEGDSIMTMEEFGAFLVSNHEPGDCNAVEVE